MSGPLDPLTGGIQDISALLPLLGTEQCEEHVASCLTKGFLYSSAAPMSIFGSLGVAIAGLKTVFAALEWNGFRGAEMLRNMGFESSDTNLGLILLDKESDSDDDSASFGSDGEPGSASITPPFVAAKRLQTMLHDLHVNVENDRGRITLEAKTSSWFLHLSLCSAVFSTLSMAPYLQFALLHPGTGNQLPLFLCWFFPALKALCGFLISVITPFIIHLRILQIAQQKLSDLTSERGENPVPGPVPVSMPRLGFGLSLCVLFISCGGLCTGYVGCFLVVQGSTVENGAIIWLAAEVILALIRMGIWAKNPSSDDASPLEIGIKITSNHLFPTSPLYAEEIWRTRTLPLCRSSEFLPKLADYAGLLLKSSQYPNVTLYYTLTRRSHTPDPQHEADETPVEGEAEQNARSSDLILFITVLEHSERTVRVCTLNDKNVSCIGHFQLTSYLIIVRSSSTITPRIPKST
jgi:hypothetical protein